MKTTPKKLLNLLLTTFGVLMLTAALAGIANGSCASWGCLTYCPENCACVRDSCSGQCPDPLWNCCFKEWGSCAQTPSKSGGHAFCCAQCPNTVECTF
jgi:hypothetical protein